MKTCRRILQVRSYTSSFRANFIFETSAFIKKHALGRAVRLRNNSPAQDVNVTFLFCH